MHWLVDEGLPKALIEWLTQRGDDVLDVADSPLRGVDDTVLWKRAGQEGRLLMTRDLGFMLPELQPQPAGVVLVRVPDTYKADAILRLVQDGFRRVPEGTLYGNVTVIEPSRVRQHKQRDVAAKKRRRTKP